MQDRLNQIVAKLKDDFKVPGISVSVYQNGKSFYCCHGSADLENKIEATPDTVYAIASSSKAFIATALCILADDGKISLDDKIKKHFPDFAMYTEALTNELTIRDALCHRTGLPRHDLMWLNLKDATMYDIVRRLQYLPPAFTPRMRMHYQNHMFILASVLVEKISGKTWQEFVRERILEPLGMDSTYLKADEYRGKGMPGESQPYVLKNDAVTVIPFEPVDHVASAGCIHSSVRDLDKWARLHLNKGELDGRRIFSEEMAKQLHNPQMIIKQGEMFPPEYEFPETDFMSYCLGWFAESYRGHKLIHHGGTINGYKSLVGFLPNDDVAFSILSNLGGNQTPTALGYIICDLALGLPEIDWGHRLFEAMNALLANMSKGKEAVEEQLKDATSHPRPLADYTGTYEHPGYGKISVGEMDGELYMDFVSEKCPLRHYRRENYYLALLDNSMYLPVKFEYDFEGSIKKVLIQTEALPDWTAFEKYEQGVAK